MKNFIRRKTGKNTVAVLLLLLLMAIPAYSYPEEKGVSAGELFRQIGIAVTIAALVGLIVVEFFLKKRIARGPYKWLLFLGLFMLPVITMMSSTSTLLEETKTVESCASCHIMHPFVNDMMNKESPTLAARHFKNKWIEKDQCYHCHTSYGVHGTAEAKRDGFRHWLLYVTDTWPEPITFKGSYPNANCMTCHGGTDKFQRVNSHMALKEKLMTDEVNCATCHGPVHPVPAERDIPQRDQEVEEVVQGEQSWQEPQEVAAFVETLDGANELVK